MDLEAISGLDFVVNAVTIPIRIKKANKQNMINARKDARKVLKKLLMVQNIKVSKNKRYLTPWKRSI